MKAKSRLSGAGRVAGVAGAPVRHSLSPAMHNAWIAQLGLDAVYVPFSPPADGFSRFAEGLRRGVIRGLNVTVPFKEEALALADFADDAARLSGAANLLLFHEDGRIEARNTDGLGLLYAFSQQAPDWRPAAGPIVLLGAGGAARGAVAALKLAGASDIRILNRTRSRAETLARELGARAFDFGEADKAFDGALCLINATSGQLSGEANLPLPGWAAAGAVAMDMVYKPLFTPFLQHAKARGFRTVDGLDMLIGQARPSFSAFYGVAPPAEPDVRALLLERLEVRP